MANKLVHLITCVIALTFTAIAPAYADTFGRRNVGAQPSSALAPDYKRVSKFRLNEPAVVSNMYAYLDGFGGPASGSQEVTAVIYADNNGAPGRKLFQSRPITVVAQDSASWRFFDGEITALPPGLYWLGLHTGGTIGIARDYADSFGGLNWYGNADSFADEATGTFGTADWGLASISIYAEYSPTLMFAGRSTVAATPSSGLSANYKRASRITVPQQASGYYITAYIDGLGGGTSAQTLRFALYADNGGVPGALIDTTGDITVTPGKQSQWRTAALLHVPLISAGTYWVAIHSGSAAGTARNYGDGAANWYGNADTFTDGSATQFGTGSAGTVTISAALIYFPQNANVVKLGRSSVAATPSSGLSANFSRGGFYSGTDVSFGTTTAFWAYLDGKGGASGSQQVRMVLYSDSGSQGVAAQKVAESDVVTIAAGQAAGWVRFPFSTPRSIVASPGYWVVLQTGGTSGVVRDYGDGAANWVGQAAPFTSTAPADFHTPGQYTNGSVEISMYLEYGTR